MYTSHGYYLRVVFILLGAPDYERIARERYGMVYPNESVYMIYPNPPTELEKP